MAQLKIPCPHCNKVTSIDETKLPDKAVSFTCPHCRGKVSVDKTKIVCALPPRATTTMMAPAPSAPEPAPAQSHADDDLGEADPLPPGAAIPPGIILGDDPMAIAEIRRRLEGYGCVLDVYPNAEEARAHILMDPPPLVIYVGAAAGAPPYAPLQPITSVPPTERRQVFLLLVAEGLKTLDGNAAFMYQVNLCLNKQEISTVAPTLYSSLDYHHRLYRNYFEAVEAS